jgi:hypothetical protein
MFRLTFSGLNKKGYKKSSRQAADLLNQKV